MMKNATLILLSLLMLNRAYPQQSKEEKESKATRAKCKVKSATVYQSDYQNLYGKVTLGQSYKVTKSSYDKSGELIEEIAYNKRGTVESWISYKNDKKGNAEEVTHRGSDGKPTLTKFCVNKYDSIGRLDQTLVYENDSTMLWRSDFFYEGNNLVEVAEYKIGYSTAADGGRSDKAYFDSYRTYKYDGSGRTVRTEFYDGAKNYVRRIECKYGADGRLSEQTDYYVSTYKYAPTGLPTESTSYGGANGDQPVATYKIVYEYYK